MGRERTAGGGSVGFWYRVRWNIRYALLTVAGPAHLDEAHDPRTRMRAERAERERRAGEGRGS
ncbi:hypothetical protein [Jannaschia sp. R86511]|uniref:hypothetical protein n=1 Tax=Jannaschia sp. R86511 TaxID=3093853 RepID=UPI0036D38E91